MQKTEKKFINMYELITCLTNAADLVSAQLANHNKQVAYLSYKIGEYLNLSRADKNDLMLAGILHDLGALSLNERLELLESEPEMAHDHAFRGAALLEKFPYLKRASNIIKYHHVPWDNGEGNVFRGGNVPYLSHIIHLADRIVVLIDHNQEVLGQVKNIQDIILGQSGTNFIPELVDAFMDLSSHEYIWLNLTYKSLFDIMPNIMTFDDLELNIDEVIRLTEIFATIIDFRSPFTANHSAGVAKTAEKLAELTYFSSEECKSMLIAGYLHDLGKLAVRKEILEKPSKLDVEEFNEIRSHTFYTYRLLQPIKEFSIINQWASFHHEKLNGTGYPFHLKERNLSLGSRIMAVADVFTAITEDRPYRNGLNREQVIDILNNMVKSEALCPYVVSIVVDNFDLINNVRKKAQKKAALKYNYLMSSELPI